MNEFKTINAIQMASNEDLAKIIGVKKADILKKQLKIKKGD
jgi:DNA integrity scanning protein DisA with diadenylate cyclase activity